MPDAASHLAPDPAVAAAPLVIAIDGPVASGKSVLGRRLAERLGWQYLDTGIMYRAIAWLALEDEIDLQDAVALVGLARTCQMEIRPARPGGDGNAEIYLNGRHATPHLRDHSVEASVSTVAAVAGVRAAMVHRQRELARRGRMVMVGRDIGTVVVPDARVKIYLVASAEVRARRRAAEMRAAGRDVSDAEVLEEVQRRDQRDAGRAVAPLRAADAAVVLDTSTLTLEASVEAALQILRERLPADEVA